MSFLSSPPRTTQYTFRREARPAPHVGVWALQRGLNELHLPGIRLAEDGLFGPGTESAVKRFQSSARLTADGIVGPHTQAQLADDCILAADKKYEIPVGLIGALVQGESGKILACVNWSVAGGVDCGYVQRRVYTPFTSSAVMAAFDPFNAIDGFARDLQGQHRTYYYSAGVIHRRDRNEYAWRLAMLRHNWPWAADQLARGNSLGTRTATWVPPGVKFPDGHRVVTYTEWAQFYAMGSHAHNWSGLVVKGVYGVPAS